MDNSNLTYWDHVVAWIGAAAFWFTGESGRVLIAAGLGGLVRWIADEQRRILTGIFSMMGGAIVGFYCWPIVLQMPALWGATGLERTVDHVAMAGFLAGTIGVSGVKIFAAILESRAIKLRGNQDGL